MLGTFLTHAGVFLLGAIFGAFALRRNPIKGAKTLSQLEAAYTSTKNDLIAKANKK